MLESNIGGGGEGGNDSPLGIIPRNILQCLSIFKGMGMGLDDILHGKPTDLPPGQVTPGPDAGPAPEGKQA